MKRILYSKAKIRFQDCDPYNHLNNSKYLDYFINEREDQVLEEYGIDMYKHIAETGNGWVVSSNQIAYLKPAFLNEKVIIESQLVQYDESSLLVEMRMWNESKTQMKSLLWSRFTYVDVKKQKRAEHESGLMDLFKSVVEPVNARTFEDRCQQLITQLKTALARG